LPIQVNTFWKVGHDARRKLCIVGFNWNSSQFRLNKLGAAAAAKSSSPAAVDARIKLKDKSTSARSKAELLTHPGDSAAAAETTTTTTTHTVSGGAVCDRPEPVKGMGTGAAGTKRRSKVYVYKPAPPTTATDPVGARSTTAKPSPLANKPPRGKTPVATGTGSTLVPSIDETSAAVESIMPEVAVPQRAGEYTIQLSASGASKTSPPPDYGYLSSLLRTEPGSGIPPPGCEAATTRTIEGGGVQASGSLSTAPLGIPSPFLLQTGLEQALGIAAFHPMSPSTSSSSSSRVAGDEWNNNDDDDLTTDAVVCSQVQQVKAFFMGNPSQSYGASPAMWDHTVLTATRHR